MQIINPKTKMPLRQAGEQLIDDMGNAFPIERGVPRLTDPDNYTKNFGIQWNKFDITQLDKDDGDFQLSSTRLFSETKWNPTELDGKDVLEVGSGAGRFSKVLLKETNANLYSIDYSDAVAANFKNNGSIAPDRFRLFQASIYEMPFPDNSFDKVICLGVLQHTPNFEASIKSLIDKAKPNGEIVVDFYPIKGWWTKINAKYILRPITKRMGHDRLLSIIEANIDWLIKLEKALHTAKMGYLARFLPIVDIQRTLPKYLNKTEIREWAVLDTFDMFSPEFDNPQTIKAVAQMFEDSGASVTFAGFEYFGTTSAAVVRGIKKI